MGKLFAGCSFGVVALPLTLLSRQCFLHRRKAGKPQLIFKVRPMHDLADVLGAFEEMAEPFEEPVRPVESVVYHKEQIAHFPPVNFD